MSSNGLNVSAETIATWEKEAKEIEERIEVDRAKLAWLRQRLAAVVLLSSPQSVSRLPFDRKDSTPIRDMSVPQVILYFLQRHEEPITRLRLREEIEQSDFPREKLGEGARYFYTVLGRMEGSGKVFRQGDLITWVPAVKPWMDALMKKEPA